MALTIQRSDNPKPQIRQDMTSHDWIFATLDNSYPAGGYDADLQDLIRGWEITTARINPFGGYTAEWSAPTRKLVIYKGGFEVGAGTNFYDTTSGRYPTLFIEALHLPKFKNRLNIDPTSLIRTPPNNVNASTVGGIGSTQFLRNDVDDSTGTAASVTTTINTGSALKVDGTLFTGTKDDRVVEITPTTVVVKKDNIAAVSMTQTAVNVAEGASLSVAGSVVKPILKTLTLFPTTTTADITGGSQFNVDGSLTPTITNFMGSNTEGAEITLNFIVDGCTIYSNTLIYLQNYVNATFKTGSVIRLKYLDDIWKEQYRQNSDGSTQVGTGTSGQAEILVGVGGTINVVGQMTQGVGPQLSAGATPTVTGGTFFTLDGAVNPSITDFLGGVEGQVLTLACIGAGNTIPPGATILTQGGVPVSLKAGEQITFKFINNVWVEQVRGTNVDGTVGAQQITGAITQPVATPLTTNGQDVSTVNRLTVNVGSPFDNTNPITTVTTVKDRQEITITFKQAATVASGVGNIQLAGNIDWSATPNSTTVLVYDSATSTWVEDSSKRQTAV